MPLPRDWRSVIAGFSVAFGSACGRVGFDVGDAVQADVGSGGDAGSASPASCDMLPMTCGPSANQSCCDIQPVPGGTYNRSNDATYPATVSPFRLDTYEITVGRFRRFVDAVQGIRTSPPATDAGAHPSNPGSGWQAAWNTSLAATTATLVSGLHCHANTETWTDTPGANENKPIDCITWYEAFAFCIWDGGRLPTEAEWNYAAAGGNEQRVYPWSSPPSSMTVDASFAVYNMGAPSSVGSHSASGDGRWRHSDLAGNVAEWLFDWYATPYPLPCNDCGNLSASSDRVFRGAGFFNVATELVTSRRNFDLPTTRGDYLGARCARSP